MINKKAMEFSWIFAIIIGAVILFLAFYFIGSTLIRGNIEKGTETAHGIDILFNPFSYLGAMGAVTAKPIELPKKAYLEFDCESESKLGSNSITIDSGIPRVVYDKYIFSENMNAKKMQTISKAFNMPWRVADLIFVFPSSNLYCFVNAPAKLESELELLNVSNIELESRLGECEENATKVCFGSFDSGRCDIEVTSTGSYYAGSVEKQGEVMNFAGSEYALLLGAIFSPRSLYYCNVKRLASRIEMQIKVYEKKQEALLEQGCSSNINLENLRRAASQISQTRTEIVSEEKLSKLLEAAQEIENLNSYECPLF